MAIPKSVSRPLARPASLIFACDANLDFPANAPAWRLFFAAHDCAVEVTADLDRTTRDLKSHAIETAFIPIANAYFLRDDPVFHGIANARMGKDGSSSQSSVLVVRQDSGITTLGQLGGKRYGRINAYCTTSYFAPAILLEQNGHSIRDFFGSISDVGAWQKQIDAVVAGRVDATMVEENIWKAKPDNAAKTRIIARIDSLPTPVVIVSSGAGETFVASLTEALLAQPRNPNDLYSGFVPYEQSLVERFFADADRAFG